MSKVRDGMKIPDSGSQTSTTSYTHTHTHTHTPAFREVVTKLLLYVLYHGHLRTGVSPFVLEALIPLPWVHYTNRDISLLSVKMPVFKIQKKKYPRKVYRGRVLWRLHSSTVPVLKYLNVLVRSHITIISP